jgi:hypothetical protein
LGVAVDGTVYVSTDLQMDGEPGFQGTAALDAGTGDVVFRVVEMHVAAADTDELFGWVGTLVAAVPLAGCGSTECALDWTTEPLGATGRVAVANGSLHVATTAGLFVFDAEKCAVGPCPSKWHVDGVFGGIAVTPTRVYLTGEYLGNSAPLTVVDASGCATVTCSPLWTSTATHQFGSPAVANGVVYASARGNPTAAWPVDGCGASTCSTAWTHAESTGLAVEVIVADGRLYLAGSKLQAFVPGP